MPFPRRRSSSSVNRLHQILPNHSFSQFLPHDSQNHGSWVPARPSSLTIPFLDPVVIRRSKAAIWTMALLRQDWLSAALRAVTFSRRCAGEVCWRGVPPHMFQHLATCRAVWLSRRHSILPYRLEANSFTTASTWVEATNLKASRTLRLRPMKLP